MCGDKGDRKNTACYNEPVTFLSLCETEYITALEASCQAAWLGFLLNELKVNLTQTTKLLVENKSTIDLVRHLASHGRNRHIKTCFHFPSEQVSNGKLAIEQCICLRFS